MHLLTVHLLTLFLLIFQERIPAIHSDKSANWPPKLIYEAWDLPSMADRCTKETGVDRKQLDEFETTRNFKKLPDSRELRCYFYCILKDLGYMREGSTETYAEAFLPTFEKLEPHEFDQYVKMGKKCVSKIKDPCDRAYSFNKCWKNNNPEFYYSV